MRAASSSLIACSRFRAVEGACCVWPVQIQDTAFCLATQESGLTTSGASVQQQQVCSRAVGTPPQGMSAAVFESTSSRVVCRSIWHNTWYAICGFALKMGTCSVIRFSFIDSEALQQSCRNPRKRKNTVFGLCWVRV